MSKHCPFEGVQHHHVRTGNSGNPASHAAWRGKTTQAAVRATAEQGLGELWDYTADPWRERPAQLAFAFATYGLDRDPVGFRRFMEALQADYSVPDE